MNYYFNDLCANIREKKEEIQVEVSVDTTHTKPKESAQPIEEMAGASLSGGEEGRGEVGARREEEDGGRDDASP